MTVETREAITGDAPVVGQVHLCAGAASRQHGVAVGNNWDRR